MQNLALPPRHHEDGNQAVAGVPLDEGRVLRVFMSRLNRRRRVPELRRKKGILAKRQARMKMAMKMVRTLRRMIVRSMRKRRGDRLRREVRAPRHQGRSKRGEVQQARELGGVDGVSLDRYVLSC